jgi:hypothetical protein
MKHYAHLDSNGAVLEHSIPEAFILARGVDVSVFVECRITDCPSPDIDQCVSTVVEVKGGIVQVTKTLVGLPYEKLLETLRLAGYTHEDNQEEMNVLYKTFWLLTKRELNRSLDTYAKSKGFLGFMELISHADSTVSSMVVLAEDALELRDQMSSVMHDLIHRVRQQLDPVPESYHALYERMLGVMKAQALAE